MSKFGEDLKATETGLHFKKIGKAMKRMFKVKRRQPQLLSADVNQKVIEIVAEVTGLPKNSIFPESLFVDDLGAAELEPVEIVFAIEEEFAIKISDDEAISVKTG